MRELELNDPKGPEAYKAYFRIHYQVNIEHGIYDPLFEACLFLAAKIGQQHDEIKHLQMLVKKHDRKLYPVKRSNSPRGRKEE